MSNRLADAQSPYLRQHADNPVDWYPWGPEALERARAESRPILLSVGYSACHWCHVMERESFADELTAGIMNARFVNIKVDREERPDLDDLYMQAVQGFTGGHGGWPMTVFLTPDGVPFYAGTYFPPVSTQGMPSFRRVLDFASETFDKIQAGDEDILTRVQDFLAQAQQLDSADPPADWLEPIAQAAAERFDPEHGGPKGAPRFPPHGSLRALLAHHVVHRSKASLELVTRALYGMIRGGLYDHLGGGFARYSVDGAWRIPHFEKMLYDNAQLVPVLVQAAQLADEPAFARIARQTLDYLLTDLCAPDGTFYTAEDADSEGEEGKFYAFSPDDLTQALGAEDGARAAALLQVTAEGTFEHGRSVLRLERPLEHLDAEDRDFLVQTALPALRARRAERPRPLRDDKIVTSWNALAIQAFAQAGAALDEPRFTRAAARAADTLWDRARPEGRLHRISTADGARVPAFLDDHANLLGATLDLYQATFDPRWLDRARTLADAIEALFVDPERDALYYTGHDGEPLLQRSTRLIAGAEPSGNGAAALHFTRLFELTDHPPYAERADRILRAFAPVLDRGPLALGAEAVAGAWRARGGLRIGVVGEPDADDTRALLHAIRRTPAPLSVVAFMAPDHAPPAPFMQDRTPLGGAATAYVCEGFTCQLPTTDPAELRASIRTLGRADRSPHRPVRAPALPAASDAWLNVDAPLSLADLRGQIVVLDFWTLCCINCLHVLPELATVERHFRGQPVTVIGVHSAKFPYEQERRAVERAVAQHGIRHPVVLDPDRDVWERYAVRAWPTLVVLDADGRVAWQRSGEVDAQTLIPVIDALLPAASGAARPALKAPAAPASPLRSPGKLRLHGGLDDGDLFVSDTGHHQIVRYALHLDEGWPVATERGRFGSGEPGLTDGDAEGAQFCSPQGLAVLDGKLYVADTRNHALRRVDLATGHTTTLAGTGALGQSPAPPHATALRSPWDVDAVPGVLFVAMAGAHQIWVYPLDDAKLVPFAGTGAEGREDGPIFQAALAQPSGLRCVGDQLYFVDSETSSVRSLDLREATLTTLVGDGLFDFGDVDGPADRARLQHPLGLAAHDGGLLIADTFNHKLKRLDLATGAVRTIAGGAEVLAEPGGVVAAGGLALLTDTANHRLVAVHLATGEVRPIPLVTD